MSTFKKLKSMYPCLFFWAFFVLGGEIICFLKVHLFYHFAILTKPQHFHEFFTKYLWQFFSWNQSCQQLKSPKPQHFHEFFTQKIDNFLRKLKFNFRTKNEDFEQCDWSNPVIKQWLQNVKNYMEFQDHFVFCKNRNSGENCVVEQQTMKLSFPRFSSMPNCSLGKF